MHSLDSGNVTASAGDPFTLLWAKFDVAQSSSISAEEEGTTVTLTGSVSDEPWVECLRPETDPVGDQDPPINLNRPQLVQYIANSINIEETGRYTLAASSQYSSAVEVVGKHIVSEMYFQ